MVDVVTPFRDRTLELLDDQAYLTDVLSRGHEQANAVAEATLRDVFARVGFVAPARHRVSRVDGMPTIGVALAIPEPWGSELQRYRASVGDRDRVR